MYGNVHVYLTRLVSHVRNKERILGACLCMMEEVRLSRRLVAAVRV